MMFAVVHPLARAWALPDSLTALPRLLLLAALGVVVYICAVALLWWAGGRTNGAERVVLNRVLPLLKRVGLRTRP